MRRKAWALHANARESRASLRCAAGVGGSVQRLFPEPHNLIHTTKVPNPRPATVSSRFDFSEGLPLGALLEAESVPGRTAFQALMLTRLHHEFGVDTSSAAGLTGALLDQWIYRAEDQLADRLMTEYKQERGLHAKSKT